MRLTAIVRSEPARAVIAIAAVAALAAIYVFLATAGKMTAFPHIGNGAYEQQAVAFVDGHFDLIQRPDPGKSAVDLRDDYWDLSLHDGRLYIYWGPVPALIGAAFLACFGASLPEDPITVAFALARAVLGTMLLVEAKQRFFRGHPWWPTVLGVATLAFGAPLTFVLARPAVYEAAIMGGQCFMLAATFLAYGALTHPRGPATRTRLFAAGTCLALAFGSRLSLAPAAFAIAALTVAESAGDAKRDRLRSGLFDAGALGLPMAAGLVALGAYNRARFGSAFDTGLGHQISQHTFHNGVRFVIPNLYSYIAKPLHVGAHFPFLWAHDWDGCPLWWLFPDLALHGGDYTFEANAGFLWTTPFYAFAPIAWLALAGWMARAAWRRSLTAWAPAPRLAWLVAVSLTLATVTMAPCLVAFGSAVRYLADASAGLAIGATLGLSLVVARPTHSPIARGALAAVAGSAVAVSIVVNLALWVEGPYGAFLYNTNRPLFDRLADCFPHAPGT